MGQDVNLAGKVAVQNVGCVFAYFCGGHKNNFPIWFRSSFKVTKVTARPVDVVYTVARHHCDDYVHEDATIAFMENDEIIFKLVLSH